MRKFSAWILGFAILMESGAKAAIDQEYVPPSTNGRDHIGDSNQFDWAQTFTVGLTGTLTGFDAWVQRDANTTLPLLYDIRRTVDGFPTEVDLGQNILAAGTIDATQIAVYDGMLTASPPTVLPHFELLDLSFPVVAGEVLALVLRSDAPSPPGTFAYSWRGKTHGEYSAGRRFARIPSSNPSWLDLDNFGGSAFHSPTDFVFRTYATEVPEPSSLYLLVVLVGGRISIRRR